MINLVHSCIPDCTGFDVLDIGGYDGCYAEVALSRGAKHVTIHDNGQYRLYPMSEPVKNPAYEYIEADISEWHKPVDIVFCFNVLYHCKNPWSFLEHLASLAKEKLCLVSWFLPLEGPIWRVCKPHEVQAT